MKTLAKRFAVVAAVCVAAFILVRVAAHKRAAEEPAPTEPDEGEFVLYEDEAYPAFEISMSPASTTEPVARPRPLSTDEILARAMDRLDRVRRECGSMPREEERRAFFDRTIEQIRERIRKIGARRAEIDAHFRNRHDELIACADCAGDDRAWVDAFDEYDIRSRRLVNELRAETELLRRVEEMRGEFERRAGR